MSALDDRFRSCLALGQREQARGNLQAAVTAYKQALDVMPEHPDANGLYGSALLQLGDASSALIHLQTAAKARRNDPWIIGTLAQAYFSTAHFSEACEAFRKASRLDPRTGQFQLGLATSLAMQGKLGEAQTLLRINTLHSLAFTWLMPRLPRFAARHPLVRVLVQTEISLARSGLHWRCYGNVSHCQRQDDGRTDGQRTSNSSEPGSRPGGCREKPDCD